MREGTFNKEIGSVCMDLNKLDMGSSDEISCLPDEVLGKILSLLPTKQAASTSVLAKRWRHVFGLVHNLDFDDSVFLQPEEGKEEWPVIWESFRNFVDRTLALQCGSPINKLSLNCHNDEHIDLDYVFAWICSALERGVFEMSLSLMSAYRCLPPLPTELLTSKTLVKLSLGTHIAIETLPLDVSLPALKSLFIDCIVFEAVDDLCDVLLPGCPMIEELTVRGDYYNISSQTIKKLTVYCDYELSCGTVWSDMSFDAPSLDSLDYTDYALSEYPLVNLESLVRAKLNLSYSGKIKRPDLTGLIVGISNVQTLHLSPASADVIARCVEVGLVLPVFKNLVSLTFGSYNERGWKLLLDLLKQTPKLETLIVQGLDGYAGDVRVRPFQLKVEEVVKRWNT